MQINRDWWDGTTVDYTNRSTSIVTVLSDNIWTKIQANPEKYIGQQWDKSICPWKINYKSDLFNVAWANPYNDMDGQLKSPTAPMYKLRKKGYTFYLSCNGNTNSGQRPGNKSNAVATAPVWLGTLSRPETDITDTVQATWLSLKAGDIRPVINFDYSKLYVVPIYHIANGNGFNFTPALATNFDPTAIYGISFLFKQASRFGAGSAGEKVAIDIISLNNSMIQPDWETTNSWDTDNILDNTLALQKYNSWDGGIEIGTYQSAGTRLQFGDTYVSGVNYPGNGINDTRLATDDAAGSVYYIPNKSMSITTADYDESVWDTEYTQFYIGAEYNYGIRRHLKSTVTYDQFYNYVAKQCAYLGFKFIMDYTHDSGGVDSEYFFIPEIDDKGVTTGNYYPANSAEAQSLPNSTWATDVYEKTPYDGTDDEEDDDPNDYDEDNETELNSNISKNIFVNMYICTNESLKHLSEYMYTTMPTGSSQDDFLTNNPLDAIVSLQLFPFSLAGDPTILKLGKLTAKYWDEASSTYKDIIVGKQINQYRIHDCGSCTYYPVYGVQDFRNYEPYCTAELELPYCGNVKIPTSVYLNHTIEVKYIIDLVTGACMALIFRDKLAYLCIPGQIGTSIPVTAIQTADLQASIMRKQTQYGESLISTARSLIGGAATTAAATAAGVGAAMSAYTGILSAFNQLEQTEFGLEHIQVPYTMHGTASPLTSYANEQYPRLIVKRPFMLPNYSPTDYGHVVGFACNITAPLSDFSGLTICATANLDGITATEAEKQLIRRALLEGIIL